MASAAPTASSPMFCKYEKMEESTKLFTGREINQIKEWVALEKIHGANLSLTVWSKTSDTVGVKIARRNDYLRDSENFFGLERQPQLLKELHDSSTRIWSNLSTKPDSLTIYGELFGGYYPHPSIPPVPNAISVQKEVAYCPDLKFCAYDIALSKNGEREFMDYDEAMRLLSEAGFMYCKPICTGTYEQVFNFPLGFLTTLPALFKLPPVENNLAEGVVVKPMKNTVVQTSKGQKRLIFKRKIPKFSERRAIPRPAEHLALQYNDPEKLELLKYEMYALMTEQRLVNAISKVGRPEKKQDWVELKKLLMDDVLETLESENEDLWESCKQDPPAMAAFMKELKSQYNLLVKTFFKS